MSADQTRAEVDPADWPPFPRWSAGRGVWIRIINVLEASGTKRDAEIAQRIRRDFGADRG